MEGTLQVQAVLENIPVVMAFIVEAARQAGFDDKAVAQIEISVDEACANVVDHAYEGMAPGEMEVSFHKDDRQLTITVRDWGRTFDLDSVPVPDVTAPLEERELGGLGLFFMRRMMDSLEYRSDPELGNELVMVKRLRRHG